MSNDTPYEKEFYGEAIVKDETPHIDGISLPVDFEKSTYEEIYNTYFKDIVENPDGSLDKDKVMRELSDFAAMMDNASKVYYEISNGKISKPNTLAYAVIGEYHETLTELIQEAHEEWLEEVRGNCTCGNY